MKVVSFQGGLGNQLFQYTFLQYLKKHKSQESIYAFVGKKRSKEHNGLELEKWFDVCLPKTNFILSILCYCIYFISFLCSKFNFPLNFMNTDSYSTKRKFIYDGYWQDKRFMLDVGIPKFRGNLRLQAENTYYLDKINKSNSVAIHIRHGDYLTEANQLLYGNICTMDYYNLAIEKILNRVENPLFFFFSDDPDYVKRNFCLQNMIVVDCNKGKDSFYDMYLMAHCKYMILANSTFSCWAAYLNQKVEKVICPSVWINNQSSMVILKEWEKIDV